jgi:hypothetical protein
MWDDDFPTATEHDYQDMNEAGKWVCALCGSQHNGDSIGLKKSANYHDSEEGSK